MYIVIYVDAFDGYKCIVRTARPGFSACGTSKAVAFPTTCHMSKTQVTWLTMHISLMGVVLSQTPIRSFNEFFIHQIQAVACHWFRSTCLPHSLIPHNSCSNPPFIKAETACSVDSEFIQTYIWCLMTGAIRYDSICWIEASHMLPI